MKRRHAAALVMMGWYMMRSPLPHLNPHAFHANTAKLRSAIH
jgi:hypothetical protein